MKEIVIFADEIAKDMEVNIIVIYQTEDGQKQIDVRLEDESVWLTQAQMAELFQKNQYVVARHINNAIKDGELNENNMHSLHNTQYKYRPTKIYDFDVIISIGNSVHSKRGTVFRIWARKIIKEYLVKGYAINECIRKEQIGDVRQLVQTPTRTATRRRGGLSDVRMNNSSFERFGSVFCQELENILVFAKQKSFYSFSAIHMIESRILRKIL